MREINDLESLSEIDLGKFWMKKLRTTWKEIKQRQQTRREPV